MFLLLLVPLSFFCLSKSILSLQILADAMGLGKTVMTIALILAKMGRGGSTDDQECVLEDVDEDERITKRITYADTEVSRKAKGSTLIVCPMALLGQWKVILIKRVMKCRDDLHYFFQNFMRILICHVHKIPIFSIEC